MNYSNLNDETLIRLITRAHTDALSELYNRYSRLVFSLAMTIVGEQATAEEITLDVFTRVWERADSYQADQAQVRTWLMRITRYRSIDVLRRKSNSLERNSLTWAELPPDRLPTAPTSEEMAEQMIRRDRVRAAVTQLPPPQKEVLAMAFFRGYTHRQIADQLNQPLGTVKTRIRSAMQKLRQMLDEE